MRLTRIAKAKWRMGVEGGGVLHCDISAEKKLLLGGIIVWRERIRDSESKAKARRDHGWDKDLRRVWGRKARGWIKRINWGGDI